MCHAWRHVPQRCHVSAQLGPQEGQLCGAEGSRGDREKQQSFSQANLNCEPQGWQLSSHEELLKEELKNLNCPRICD